MPRLRPAWARQLTGLGLVLLGQSFLAASALARAGGGGSSSGGSSGGGFSSGGSHFSSSNYGGSSSSGNVSPILLLTIIAVFVVIAFISAKKARADRAARSAALRDELSAAAAKDTAWDQGALTTRASEVFYAFEKAWDDLDVETMRGLLTAEYFKRMVLELQVLTNLKRRNAMEDVKLVRLELTRVADAADNAQDRFDVSVTATATDSLIDTVTGQALATDRSVFTEYWHFRREADAWKLDLITQSTEERTLVEPAIADFAKRNGFYYDADFGWLMMPNKGAIFQATDFGKSDINNHVIGWYRNKIVEFYTYLPVPQGQSNYVVAQAILPITYRDILLKKRPSGLLNFAPKGLREQPLEFGDFNRKFVLYADPQDLVSSFELLTPNFMLKVFDLPFELNIEVVGNVLYFYTEDRTCSYDQMLEVISWAFDEMKQ